VYVGVEIIRPGRHVATGWFDDANGRPVARLRFNDTVDAALGEFRFLAFGKLLRDEAAASPYVLRDVQAWRMVEDASPDRELVPRLRAVHKTSACPPSLLSDREWDSPRKRHHIEGLQQITAAQERTSLRRH
jgi:hypothetical protein